ncbi:hypothetical protein [Gordoniibacillus kamchatkensis]|uniref:hypothetical protein n=1 Tax=Gordoniibacillus kamchatkensis TaxID=1590651 RepID=UPI0006963D31|nr:hypothetical protein [Paenibacillus sp. VKM B-2647]
MTPDFERQLELIKLDMLASLARSQRALARIVESAADVAAASPETALRIAEHAEALARYQRQLALRIAGVLPRTGRRRSLHPAPPWLRRGVARARAFRGRPRQEQ